MKRTIVLASILGLAGCNGGTSSSISSNSDQQGEPIEDQATKDEVDLLVGKYKVTDECELDKKRMYITYDHESNKGEIKLYGEEATIYEFRLGEGSYKNLVSPYDDAIVKYNGTITRSEIDYITLNYQEDSFLGDEHLATDTTVLELDTASGEIALVLSSNQDNFRFCKFKKSSGQ